MPGEVPHTSWAEQQEFLALPPASQNLMIYMSSKETNGKLAEAIKDIARLKPMVQRHDFAFKVAALVFGGVIAAGPFIVWGLGLIK